ncbi:MAG: response regulator, partial [Deltaproteobacteria bacterium]|nr:response regulator [Deltaproteobacteria bacterium]
RYGGTGLGTTIAKQLVEMMGGRLWAESTMGAGSTFQFIIPCRPGQSRIVGILPPYRIPKGLKVLVVDDNSTHRIVIERILLSWGLQPILTDSGPAALEKLHEINSARDSLDLAILDMDMPVMSGWELGRKIHGQAPWSGLPLILMSTTANYEKILTAEDLKAIWVTKPVSHEELLKAIFHFIKPKDQPDEPHPNPLEMSGASSVLKILLVEDNPMNQKMVMTILQKRGHHVITANNGFEALAAFEQNDFNLILMDVQMPEMDGLQATKLIRQKEQGATRRTPIIAMTAHAKITDQERCLQAGMDTFITKPFNIDEFLATIEGSGVKLGAGSASNGSENTTDQVINRSSLMNQVEGDLQLLNIMAEMALRDIPDRVEQIKKAIAANDASKLEFQAHSLKVMTSSFCGARAAQVALKMELLGSGGNLTEANRTIPILEKEIECFVQAIREVCKPSDNSR